MLKLDKIPTQRLADIICHAYGWPRAGYGYNADGINIKSYTPDGAASDKFVSVEKICELFVWKNIKIGDVYTEIEHLSDEDAEKYFNSPADGIWKDKNGNPVANAEIKKEA